VSAIADAYYMLGRLLRATWRQPIWVIVEIVQPTIWLILYGQLFHRVVEIPGFGARSHIQLLMPGVAVMAALSAAPGRAWA
jgi:ABC-2 type transport system permease protein